MKKFHPKLPQVKFKLIIIFFIFTIPFIIIICYLYLQNKRTSTELSQSQSQLNTTQEQLSQLNTELDSIKSQDQSQINKDLNDLITNLSHIFSASVSSYESLLKLKDRTPQTDKEDELYKELILLLSNQKYPEALTKLEELNHQITIKNTELDQALASATSPPAPINNTPPNAGYSKQQVATSIGNYTIALVAADLGSTRVIVDTASASNCANNCPVLPLSDYVSRNNAFAAINGSYFCPASYPSCAGKENSFDTLLMNKDKTYFNSDNNVYSNVPAVIFGSGWIRFVSRSLEWGRDTSIDSMLANQALLIQGGSITFGGDGDPKKGSRGSRSFVANKGNTVYIGVVFNATVAEAAIALHALGMENALNLDSGGSTALWSGGYKVGPGRAIPNAILFVQK